MWSMDGVSESLCRQCSEHSRCIFRGSASRWLAHPLFLQELLHEALEQARRLPDDLVMLDCPLKDSVHL